MVWVIYTPTPQEGAEITGLTPGEWQEQFEVAYWRDNRMMLDALGVDVRQLPPTVGWGASLDRLRTNMLEIAQTVADELSSL